MQLLIVDDESHVVDRLSATIDWPSIGIGQVYRAYSAYEALSLLQQFSIDIVITDIQMPGMTGLELIGEIKRRWTRTKYILLSGYSDFEYAKEAIHHQVEDYLLKPVKEQELLATVGRLKDKLVHEWEQVLSVRNLTRTLRENLPLLKGNLLNELLQGRPIEEAVLLDRMQTLGLPDMSRRHCALMLVRMEEPFIDYDFSSASLIEYAICNMAEELFEGAFELWHAKDAHDYLVFVVVCKEETAGEEGSLLFERTASHLQTVVREFLKGHISVLVSGSPNAIIQEQSLGIHYNQGNDILDYLVDPSVFEYKDGYVNNLTLPGLGIEVNEAKVREMAAIGHNWRNPVWRQEDGTVAEW